MKQSALMSLAGFLDQVSNENFRAGKWISASSADDGAIIMPYVDLGDVARNFFEAAYDDGWMDTKFDWMKWAKSPEAEKLLGDNPAALAAASPQDLSRLVTVCIRRDKYVEGTLLDAFDRGLILRIVKRAAALANLKKLSHQQAGSLGELLALAKLNSLGLAAYMSPEGAPGHDLIVIVEDQHKSIEVKTRQFLYTPNEITRWPVDLATKGDADFFLFVELDLKNISPTFYLLTNEQARTTNKSFGDGQGNCYPAQVRLLVEKNDFSPLLAGKSR